jgi:type IV secretory pathway VirB2 component (pilin)
MRKKTILTVIILSLLVVAPVFAQKTTNPTGPGTQNPTGPGTQNPTSGQSQSIKFSFPNPFAKAGNDLFTVMKNIVNQVILPIGGVVAVLAFIFTGFKYVMAKGKPDKIQEANRAFLYTVIGTAILLGAWVIANVIGNTVNQLMP